jgi:hypothetical protein
MDFWAVNLISINFLSEQAIISSIKHILIKTIKLEFIHKGNFKTSRREWEIEVKAEDHWNAGDWDIL